MILMKNISISPASTRLLNVAEPVAIAVVINCMDCLNARLKVSCFRVWGYTLGRLHPQSPRISSYL